LLLLSAQADQQGQVLEQVEQVEHHLLRHTALLLAAAVAAAETVLRVILGLEELDQVAI
jgi:hypothetical protein